MKENPKCLQGKIGSCSGCEIQSLAKNKITKVAEEQRKGIIDKITSQLCPDDVKMQQPEILSRKIWA
jgi:hypothetical protein